jgi:hypothetical protein
MAFFHIHASARRKRNHIFCLKSGDTLATVPEEMEDMATQHFTTLIGEPAAREFTLNLEPLHLPSLDLAHLELPLSEDEIWAAIRALPADKASGPDGFTARFFQTCWSTVKDTVMRAVSCFDSDDARGFARLNDAYIVLLPKKEGAICVGDYRPVSLIQSIAKIVAKAMALRLAGPLPHLVDTNQSAFVKGRTIQDNFFMVQHSIRSLHRWKTPGLMLKLDMAKAFYSVSWPFLAQILRHRGFGPKWIARLATLLSTANTRVLINGSAGARF